MQAYMADAWIEDWLELRICIEPLPPSVKILRENLSKALQFVDASMDGTPAILMPYFENPTKLNLDCRHHWAVVNEQWMKSSIVYQ